MQRIVTILTGLALLTLGFYFYVVIDGYANAPDYVATAPQAQQAAAAEAQKTSLSPEKQALVDTGKGLFRTNCGSCHALNQKRIGPKLAGVNEKYADDKEWLYSWIQNAPAKINAGDPRAIALYEEYDKQMMTAFPSLADSDVEAILTYIEVES
jgi:mono/diheme cytochrome c family protein